MTTDNEQVNEEKYVDVRIYGIPEEDWNYFKDIIKIHEGDRVKAFRSLLDSYNREQLLGEVLTRLQVVEQRMEDLEQIKKKELIKTFGGSNG